MRSKATLFPGQVGAPSADFAYGTPQSESSEGADDGTPWCPDIVSDEWAFFEALLFRGAVAPNNNPDVRHDSQYYDALSKVMLHWIGKGYQSQIAGTAEELCVPVNFGPVLGSDWSLLTSVPGGQATRLRYVQSTVDTSKRLVIPMPMNVLRFAITGVRVTVTNTYTGGGTQPMRVMVTSYSRENTNTGAILMNRPLENGERKHYSMSSHVVDRTNAYNIEIQPATGPNNVNGTFPAIHSIEVTGTFNTLPLTAGPAGA